ncbi:MAG: hypothetical protein LKI23_06070 [Bifidobacterium crudilactis]|jgi:hypothetical protein|nr:hypothetical protein [Bifidobacterium crudilactis]
MSDGKNTDDETSLLFPNGESGGEQHRTSAAPYTDASKTSDAGEATVRFLPLDVPQPPAQSGGDAPVDGSGMQALTQAPRHGHKGLVIAVIALLLLVAAVVGGFFAARSYYSGKAAPGVSLGGQNVTGQDEAALTATVKNAFATSTVTVKDDGGKTLNAKLSDLGVTLDEKTTVANLLNAKSSEALAQVNPFSPASVPLTVHTDDAKMTDFLTGKLVDDEHQAHAATVEYDTASNSFVAKAGSDGRTPDIANVKTAVNKLVSNPGDTSEAKVTYREVKSPISEQVAKEAADAANGRLANAIVIDNGEGKTFTIPSKEIAQWTSFSSDLSKGTISVTYNQDAMKAYLKEQLPSALNQDSVNEENVKNTQGTGTDRDHEGRQWHLRQGHRRHSAGSGQESRRRPGSDDQGPIRCDEIHHDLEGRAIRYSQRRPVDSGGPLQTERHRVPGHHRGQYLQCGHRQERRP